MSNNAYPGGRRKQIKGAASVAVASLRPISPAACPAPGIPRSLGAARTRAHLRPRPGARSAVAAPQGLQARTWACSAIPRAERCGVRLAKHSIYRFP